MTSEDALRLVATTRPPLLYITGKTCTGKTTFSRQLAEQHGYHSIILDEIVRESVIVPFSLQAQEGDVYVHVYRTTDRPDWVDRFVAAVRKRTQYFISRDMPVLIEGALANTDTIQRLFEGHPNAEVLYFHPKSHDSRYLQNLLDRFKDTTATNHNGLPNGFWKHIPPKDFALFCADSVITPTLHDAVAAYCQESTEESRERLKHFKAHLPHLQVVEI